jgi:hypothetical protein
MLSVIMQSVIMQSVVKQSVVKQSVGALNLRHCRQSDSSKPSITFSCLGSRTARQQVGAMAYDVVPYKYFFCCHQKRTQVPVFTTLHFLRNL